MPWHARAVKEQHKPACDVLWPPHVPWIRTRWNHYESFVFICPIWLEMVSNPLKQEVQSFLATPSWKRLLFSMMQLAWDAPWCTCSLGSLGFFKTVTVGELLVKNIEENKQEMLTSTMEAVQAPKKNQTLQREEIPVVEENSAAIFFGQCCEHNYSIWNMNIYIYIYIWTH